MNRRDILHRLAGIAALAVAGLTAFLHGEVWLAPVVGAASGIEAAVGLSIFALASLGILLVTRGAKLRDGWARDCQRTAGLREQHAKPDRPTPLDMNGEHRQIMLNLTAIVVGRTSLATFLVIRARQAAARTKPVAATTTAEKLLPRSDP